VGLNNYLPQYKLIANDKDITATIRQRFMHLRLTDESGLESDVLEITLSDSDPSNPIDIPPTGAELEFFLGYNGNAQRMGLFVVDEFEFSGWPGEMVIRAKATAFTQSKKGKQPMQTQKTRSWPAGTIGAMVQKIASDNGMKAAVSESLADIDLPHTDQTDESDLNLLIRIAKRFDAVVKTAGGKLVFAKKGEAKTMSGTELPKLTLTPSHVSNWRMTLSKRETAGQVTAYYQALKEAKRHAVTAGKGEPERKLKMTYPTQALALAAARSDLEKRARGEKTLNISMPGRPDVMAEQALTLQGFRPGVDGDWRITSVTHNLDENGYSVSFEAELPTPKEAPQTQDDAE